MKNQNFKISHVIQKRFSIAYSEVYYFVCSCIVCVADATEQEEERGESEASSRSKRATIEGEREARECEEGARKGEERGELGARARSGERPPRALPCRLVLVWMPKTITSREQKYLHISRSSFSGTGQDFWIPLQEAACCCMDQLKTWGLLLVCVPQLPSCMSPVQSSQDPGWRLAFLQTPGWKSWRVITIS